MGEISIKETKCLSCGKRLNGIGDCESGESTPPGAGDPVACIGCGAVMAYEAGELRPFTEDEAAQLASEPDTMADLARLVGRIRFIRAGAN